MDWQGTGIAVGYTGASLLTAYVAYLSPWVPVWLWLAVGSVMVLGVIITAISTVGAVSTLAPNPKAFKMVRISINLGCLVHMKLLKTW